MHRFKFLLQQDRTEEITNSPDNFQFSSFLVREYKSYYFKPLQLLKPFIRSQNMIYRVSSYIPTFKLRMFKDAEMHLLWAKNQNLGHPFQVWVKLQLALHLLLLKILQLHQLSPPLLPPMTLPDRSLNASPASQLLYCAAVLIKVLCCKIRNSFNLLCFLAILCVWNVL